jgi:hypothetical protein
MITTTIIIGVSIIVIIYLLYLLIVKGLLWKILVFGFGWIGMYLCLRAFLPIESNLSCMTISECKITYAELVPSIIVLLALIYSHSND